MKKKIIIKKEFGLTFLSHLFNTEQQITTYREPECQEIKKQINEFKIKVIKLNKPTPIEIGYYQRPSSPYRQSRQRALQTVLLSKRVSRTNLM
ncbi:hypothetical protein pb186bvf_001368 [Paramecium bursaria]